MSIQEYTIEQFFPTEPWLEEYQKAIDADKTYAKSSEGWGVGFNGAMIFHITNIPLAEQTIGDLPDELGGLIEERFSTLADDKIEQIVTAAPEEIRSDVYAREADLREALCEDLMAVSLVDSVDYLWPELEEEVPSLIIELIDQLDQYVVNGDTVYAFIDLYDSECREAEVVTNLDERDHGFVIRGPYDEWEDLVSGNAGIIDQLMGGAMDLDGDMQKILQYSDAAVRLTDIAADTESRFLF